MFSIAQVWTTLMGTMKRIFSMKFRRSILLYLVLATAFRLFVIKMYTFQKFKNDKMMSLGKFTIQTDGCRIPTLIPFDESIKRFIEYPKIKPCPNFAPVAQNKTHIWIKENYIEKFNIDGPISCCYKSFYRPTSYKGIPLRRVDDRVQYNECVNFTQSIKVHDEFVKVECLSHEKIIYKQFFLFAFKKSPKKPVKKIYSLNSTYNVLILGIDSVSRLNFHRTMPKTLAFLKNKGAVELFGYNKVADNTYPNLVPMLLGIHISELHTTCLPNSDSNFDNCPFIWKSFQNKGHYTAFAEDTSTLATFNYGGLSGFRDTPTDYYIRTFIKEAENIVGNNKLNSYLCMNEKYFYEVLLQYIGDLVTTLSSTRLFGFFWEATMTHDYLNYPKIMDEKYENLLNGLYSSKYLEETILFMVSDHGMRFGQIRSTTQGRLEERLPFVYILVPDSFRNVYKEAYKNLELNSRRLTTPFDIHATLNDLVNLDDIIDENIKARKVKLYSRNRSISLFLPIFENRTCQLAGIDDHWCTCHRSHKLSLKSPEALTVASQLLEHVNVLLHDYPQCASLKLTEIKDALELKVDSPNKGEEGWREFMVVVRTEPGGGIFEGTIRHDTQNWFPIGTVSRLNLYGNQSHCIDNSHLKLYCFCL